MEGREGSGRRRKGKIRRRKCSMGRKRGKEEERRENMKEKDIINRVLSRIYN